MSTSRSLVEAALELMPEAGLLVHRGRVAGMNALARDLFALASDAPDVELATLGLDVDLPDSPTEVVQVTARRGVHRTFTGHLRARHLRVDDDLVVLVTIRDVSEVQRVLERLEGAVEAARIGVFDHDQITDSVWVSPRLRTQSGWGQEEPLSMQRFAEGLADQEHVLEAIMRAHDPAGDGHFDAEIQIDKADGTGSVWVHSRAQTYFGEVDGQRVPVRTIGANVDISDRKRLEAQLRQAQKMEAVGRLASGVAHDFNNLLSVIMGATGLVVEELSEDDPNQRELQDVLHAADRASALTGQLLAFARKTILRPRVLRLDDVLASLSGMIDRLVGETVAVAVYSSPSAGPVKADWNVIEQVILNLVVNARDAMPSGGRLTLETQPFLADEAYVRDHPGMRPGRHTALAVSDTGHGMDEATRSMIFEPFFTTKELGKGTGLGLAMVHGIVEQSGGHIWVYSEVGRGTTFKVYLPCTAEVGAEEGPAPSLPPRPAGGLILVVEDDQHLRRVIVTILERAGYATIEAGRPLEALALCRDHPGPIDLLFTDIVMPEMNGRELADLLVSERPSLRVLYSSGYTENTIVHQGVLEDGVNFVPKPITPDTLLAAVADALVGE